MNGLAYLLQVNLYLTLFLGFYSLVLRNETFFGQNRVYLNLSCLLSFIIPFITSEWFQTLFITEQVRAATSSVPVQIMYEPVIIGGQEVRHSWTIVEVLSFVYLIGASVFLARFIILLALLNRRIHLKDGAAFSFFKKIVVDETLPGRETIVNHEQVHSRQWHSADVMLIELAGIINWFNPVIYLYKKEIRHLHEFIADEVAAEAHVSKSDYAMLLVSNTLGISSHQLTNSFFNESLLKRRIVMLSKTRSQKAGLLKYGLCVPLFTGMLVFSSAAVSRPETFKLRKLIESGEPGGSETTDSQDFAELKKHISKTIKYPVEARQKYEVGYVLVTFEVDDEKISNVKALNETDYGFREEVLRAVNSFPRVKAEESQYSLLVTFQLAGRKTEFKLPNEGAVRGTKFLGEVAVTAYGTNTVSPPPPPMEKKDQQKQEKKPASFQLKEIVVSNDKVAKAAEPGAQDDKPIDFASVDVLPKFPGGDAGFGKFLSSTIKYPGEAKANHITGRVIATFVVEKDGSLSGIKILRGLGYGTDEETVRVLKASPKWTAAMKDGKPVRVQYTIPVFYQLGKSEDYSFIKSTTKLVLVDGKILSSDELQKFDFHRINEMKVLEPAEAQEQFGAKGKDGAILITTKKN